MRQKSLNPVKTCLSEKQHVTLFPAKRGEIPLQAQKESPVTRTPDARSGVDQSFSATALACVNNSR